MKYWYLHIEHIDSFKIDSPECSPPIRSYRGQVKPLHSALNVQRWVGYSTAESANRRKGSQIGQLPDRHRSPIFAQPWHSARGPKTHQHFAEQWCIRKELDIK